MKGGPFIAASALLGTASAGLHRMKLEKIPLSEQLVRLFKSSETRFQLNSASLPGKLQLR